MVVMVVVAMVNGQVTGSSGCDAVLLIVFPLNKKITTGGTFGVLVFPLA